MAEPADFVAVTNLNDYMKGNSMERFLFLRSEKKCQQHYRIIQCDRIPFLYNCFHRVRSKTQSDCVCSKQKTNLLACQFGVGRFSIEFM